jgi:hypothetical protein
MRPTSNIHPVGGGVGWIYDPESQRLAERGKERAMLRSLKDLRGLRSVRLMVISDGSLHCTSTT